MRVLVTVDRVVLRGVDPADGAAVAEALRQALAAQLAAPELASRLAGLRHMRTLRTGPVTAPSTGAAGIGRAVGEGVARALAPPPGGRGASR